MKINRLFSLELERNSLRPYQIAVEVGTVFILGFIYLMAAIPKIDPGDSDAELFSSYNFVIGLTLVVMMGIFSVISATMSSKFIVDEYRGKKAILLFSYPISRKKIMETKILLVFLFTFGSMLISGAIVLAVFMITESLVPIGNDIASLGLMLTSIIYLVCYALIAAFCGIASSWIGFRKQSVIATIVASCIIMVTMCQIVAMTFFSGVAMILLLAGMGIITFGPKKIVIVDYDNVEESNLGRQLLYKESDIGTPKAEAAARAISEMNKDIEIEAYNKKIEKPEDVLDVIDGVNLVICAIDEPPFVAQRIVNEAIVKANVPCVFGASQVSRGRVFTVIPGVTGCFDCLNLHYSMNDPQFVEQFVAFRKIDFAPPTIAYAPAIFQLTAAIVDEAVRVITGYAEPRSLGTQYEINFEDGSSFRHPSWKRYKEKCPTCGKGKKEDWEIFQYYENRK